MFFVVRQQVRMNANCNRNILALIKYFKRELLKTTVLEANIFDTSECADELLFVRSFDKVQNTFHAHS